MHINADLIEQRARVLCLATAVARNKRLRRAYASLERRWVMEKARLVAMEAGHG